MIVLVIVLLAAQRRFTIGHETTSNKTGKLIEKIRQQLMEDNYDYLPSDSELLTTTRDTDDDSNDRDSDNDNGEDNDKADDNKNKPVDDHNAEDNDNNNKTNGKEAIRNDKHIYKVAIGNVKHRYINPSLNKEIYNNKRINRHKTKNRINDKSDYKHKEIENNTNNNWINARGYRGPNNKTIKNNINRSYDNSDSEERSLSRNDEDYYVQRTISRPGHLVSKELHYEEDDRLRRRMDNHLKNDVTNPLATTTTVKYKIITIRSFNPSRRSDQSRRFVQEESPSGVALFSLDDLRDFPWPRLPRARSQYMHDDSSEPSEEYDRDQLPVEAPIQTNK